MEKFRTDNLIYSIQLLKYLTVHKQVSLIRLEKEDFFSKQ